MITEESIERLKQMIDIADVVGSYLELTKSGASFKALCPFHGEKTPSLIIHPQKGFYHCFGCGASGDAIKFVMEYEKLTYPEAIEKIAGLYNVSLSYTDVASNAPKSSLLEKLSSFYQKRLESEPNALEYLKSRSVHTNMIERFEIGYAPASSETLRFLEGGFFSQNEALELGALAEENGRLYARFIDRLTFPIYAPNRKLVGFGGRTMGNHPAKYINSPQTKLFNKSKLLYGVIPDMATFGKVIGGGMPVGAFGGRSDIMACLSPEGAVYQAGTLSGNPVAMAAGIASIRKIKQGGEALFSRLESLALRLMEGFKKCAQKHQIPLQTTVRGSMFGFFFNHTPVSNFEEALQSDTALFAKFHQAMLERGVYLACSQFETGFICASMDESLVDEVIAKIDEALEEIGRG